MNLRFRTLGILLVTVCFVQQATSTACDKTPGVKAGYKLFLDPDTGAVRPPTDAERAELQRQTEESDAATPDAGLGPAQESVMPDGGIRAELGRRFMSNHQSSLDATGDDQGARHAE